MAITLEDVVSPAGEIEHKTMFADDTAEEFVARIEGYITDAVAHSALDDAQYAWVHYRAFMAVHLRLAAQPASADLPEGGSYTFILTQINLYKKRAEEFLAEYEDATEPVVVVERYYPTSGAVANEFRP